MAHPRLLARFSQKARLAHLRAAAGELRNFLCWHLPRGERAWIRPSRAQIEVTTRCNLRCPMCARTKALGRGGQHMPVELFARVMRELDFVSDLHLQGFGEPLMHPRLAELIRIADPRRRFVATNTNATVLGPRQAEMLVASGLHEVKVSLDSPEPATYAEIRPPASLASALRGLRLLREARQRAGSARPRVVIAAVCQPSNLPHLEALVELSLEAGADHLWVQSLRAHGDAQRPAEELASEQAAAEALERQAAARGLSAELALTRQADPPDHCWWPWRGVYVTVEGDVALCCEKLITDPARQCLGNLDEVPFRLIWNSPEYRRARQSLLAGRLPGPCAGCPVFQPRGARPE